MPPGADERSFLDRIAPSFGGAVYRIPAPTLAPLDRLRRRLAFRNQIYVYPRRSELSGQSIISMFSPDTPFGVIANDEWFGDVWDAARFGRDFDFGRGFFDQMRALRDVVPHLARSALQNENCDYASNLSSCKNCYLIFNSTHTEDSMYGENLWKCKDCVDSSYLSQCELCYDCLLCDNCYNLQSSWECEGCSDSVFLLNCIACRHCFGCVNLRRREYCIYNRQVSADEYRDFMGTTNLAGRRERLRHAAEAEKFWRANPRPHVTVKHCENATGNYLFHSKDLEQCFLVRDGESLAHCAFLYGGARDCRDFTFVGIDCELMYECAWCALNCRLCRFCYWCLQSQDLLYCWHCIGCRDCFGCVGLRNKEFCIFNKQYSRSEYQEAAARIISRMQRTGEWGEFYPASMSPIPYNHSIAQRFFPLTREQALQSGCSWYDKPLLAAPGAIPAEELPDANPAGEEALVFTSVLSGAAFRVTSEERKRCRLLNVPLPEMAYDERLTARARKLGGMELYRQRCQKTGREILTGLPPGSGWTLWCREAYDADFN